MPVKSKKQYKFMQLLAHGKAKKAAPGLTKEKAKEFLEETEDYKSLPEEVKKKKK